MLSPGRPENSKKMLVSKLYAPPIPLGVLGTYYVPKYDTLHKHGVHLAHQGEGRKMLSLTLGVSV